MGVNFKKIIAGATLLGYTLFGSGCAFKSVDEYMIEQDQRRHGWTDEETQFAKDHFLRVEGTPIIKTDRKKKKFSQYEQGMNFCKEVVETFQGSDIPTTYELGLNTSFEKRTGVDLFGEMYPGEAQVVKRSIDELLTYPLAKKIHDRDEPDHVPLYVTFKEIDGANGLHFTKRLSEENIPKVSYSLNIHSDDRNKGLFDRDEREKNIIVIDPSFRARGYSRCRSTLDSETLSDSQSELTDVMIHEDVHNITEALSAIDHHQYNVELARLFLLNNDYSLSQDQVIQMDEHEVGKAIHKGIRNKYFGNDIKSGDRIYKLDGNWQRETHECSLSGYMGTCDEVADMLVPKSKSGEFVIAPHLGKLIHKFHKEGDQGHYLFRENVSKIFEPSASIYQKMKDRFEKVFKGYNPDSTKIAYKSP